jgi:Ca-activated chloride channel homolog
MNFGAEKYFWLLFLLPAALIFLLVMLRRRRVLSHRFIEAGLLDKLQKNTSTTRRIVKIGMLILAGLFLVFALTQPRWGKRIVQVKQKGVDIFVALDVSNSMKAADIYPSRLEKSKLEIKNLVRKMGGDRVGLIAFAGSAFVVSPLTIDYSVFEFLLDDLDAGSISQGGTDIEAVINMAVGSFPPSEKTEKVLVIFTDGEKQWGDPVGAAAKAKAAGVRIYTVGIGSAEGATIEVADRATGTTKTITTKLDLQTLKQIANAGGGDWVVNRGPAVDIDRIYFDNINKLRKSEIEEGKKEIAIERFQLPCFFALLIVAVEAFVRD